MTDNTSGQTTGQPVYPPPQPAGTDPRFTYGLLFHIADALVRNGFPRPIGTDWADLMLALHRFIYQETTS